MDRNADRMNHLAVDIEWTDALGHHRDRDDLAAVAPDFDRISVIDRRTIVELWLQYPVGTGGLRLSVAQRQRSRLPLRSSSGPTSLR
jgi:hypothetical protein